MKSLLLIQLLALLLSCKKQESMLSKTETVSGPIESTAKTYSYLALGDSYTIGQSVEQNFTFPYQLKSAFAKENILLNPITVVAQTGWTTGELSSAIKARGLNNKYDIVTLLIGVNNQYRGYSQETYRVEFVELLNTAVTYAGGNKAGVFVLSIPDWGVTPYANGADRARIAKEIDEFNAINKEETEKRGISYTNITGISRMASTDEALIANDGLHPSGKMYAMWVEAIFPQIKGSLPK